MTTKSRWLAMTMLTLVMARLSAAELVNYQVGDKAAKDVATPVALDVIDPEATAALRFEEAIKTPAVFRFNAETASAVENRFLELATQTHTNFVAAVQNNFHAGKISEDVINSPDFGYFITAFNIKHRDFPVTSELAAEWARGNDGQTILDGSLNIIRGSYKQPLRADELPTQFLMGETVRLVPVKSQEAKLSADTAEQHGKLIITSSLLTLSQAQMQLRKQFQLEQQPYARALSALLKADCTADAELTDLIRSNATHQLTVARHFDPGQIVIRRGETVDAGTKVVLDTMNEKLMPGLLTQEISAERARVEQEQEQAQASRWQALQAAKAAQQSPIATARSQVQTDSFSARARQIYTQYVWLIDGLAAILGITVAVLGWRLLRRQPKVTTLPSGTFLAPPAKVEVAQPPAITPQVAHEVAQEVAQVVRETVMQEMALQRRELMLAQQSAADEIAELVQRLDRVQAPFQERLEAYEVQIKQLESELAARTEENRELLKAKIELMRRQLEYEKVRNSEGSWQPIDGPDRN